MPDSSRNEFLLSILGIAHATSIRGEGISLCDALGRVDYAAARSQLRISEIAEVLRANPQIVEDWVLYCEDKRTDGGWYLDSENLEIGELGIPSSLRTFHTLEEAVAGYILAELDTVARLNGQA
jgi:hypothetical protein